MTIDLQLASIDSNDPAAVAAVSAEVRDSESFYADRDGRGVYYHGSKGTSFISSAPESAIGDFLVERGFVRLWQRRQAAPLQFQVPYRAWLGRRVLELQLPEVEGAVNLPAVISSGSRLVRAAPGIGPDRKVYTGTAIAAGAPDRAYPRLREWFSALQFQHETFRANLFGYLCAAVARTTIAEFPLLILDATSRKVGKTALAGALHYLLTGRHMSPLTHTGDEAELEKRIAGRCGEPGPIPLVFDNIRPKRGQTGTVRSQFFAVAATTPCPALRGPYKRKPIPLNYPIIILTMNESAVETDLHDRVVRLVLSGEPGRFLSPHPLEYVEKHRDALLAEILDILEQVDLAAQPVPQTRLVMFERTAGGAARVLGLEAAYDPDAVDTADGGAREFVAAVKNITEERGHPPTWAELVDHVRLAGNLTELQAMLKRSTATTVRAQGRCLRALALDLLKREIHLNGVPLKMTISDTGVEVAC